MADEPNQESDVPEAEPEDAADFVDEGSEGEFEGPPPGGTVEELLHDAEANRRRANAAMSLVHKEHFAFLGANCLFLAGSLAAWRIESLTLTAVDAAGKVVSVTNGVTQVTSGLSTIRGAAIFALSLYAFWTLAIGLYTKRTVVWPFLINMLLGLWAGLGGVVQGIRSEPWKQAYDALEKRSHTFLETMLTGMGTIAPAFWMLAGGSLLVLFILLKGIVGGATQSRAKSAAEGGGGERRRNR